jgi:uncharacterized protein YbbC (DUF1343 family)/CubicO group peptidase (beta-lactamase class C family)
MHARGSGKRALWIALACLICGQTGDALRVPGLRPSIEAAIAGHKLPGAVVAAGNARGLFLLEAYGQRALVPTREPMTVDTIFDLASLTKSIVTATLIMQLVEAGRVQLDASASTYLPELAAHGKAGITVRQLLLHDSGLRAGDPLSDYAGGPRAALDAILSLPLDKAAGHNFVYSDLGYIVLGRLIERVTGESLAVRASQQLFQPLRMSDSGFLPDAARLPRIAPTERLDRHRAQLESPEARAYGVIRGRVHDPRAFRLGGVAGNAGLFSTAQDLSRYARMLLSGGTLDGARVLSAATIATMTAPEHSGDSLRALGWDVHSHYSRLRGQLLSERAFGHGGFTGVSLWVDPGQDLFVIFLSSRLHPDGRGYVIPLVGAITDQIVQQLQAAGGTRAPLAAPEPTPSAAKGSASLPPADHTQLCNPATRAPLATGIDVLRADGFSELAGRKVGLVVNNASRARDGTPTFELFRAQTKLQLKALFAPEHGLTSTAEGKIANGSAQGLPVYSLFGKTRRPTPEMLRGLDTIVFDLADVGTRFYTYMSTLRQILEACAGSDIQVVVLDRPNPVGAGEIEGPVASESLESFVNYHPLPIRHGMTAGELAELLVAERHISTRLRVVPMQGYTRELLFEDTGLTWYAPSPNLPNARSAILYPALGLLESTNLSVGRGTDQPFEFVGAPWVDAQRLVRALRTADLPGVSFEAEDLTPRSDRYAGQVCHGVRLRLDRPRAFRAVLTGLHIAQQLFAQHPRQWQTRDLDEMIGDPAVASALLRGASVSELQRLWQPALTHFAAIRQAHLRYPSCDEAF